MKQIMIIDDDECIGDMIEEVLRRENYQVSRAYSGSEALLYLSTHRPNLILLDLMLPGLKGEEILPKINGIPVIVVSAKVDITDKVDLLLGGAADYITKPFDTQELLARILVQLRNISSSAASFILSFNDLIMDTASHTVSIDGTPVKLTKTEYAILKLLMRNPNQVTTKSLILDQISVPVRPDDTEDSLAARVLEQEHILYPRALAKLLHDLSKS